MGVKVLVTGATGFIGGAIARSLHAKGFSVTATGRNPEKLRALEREGINTHRGNLLDLEFAKSLCQKQDAVIHCAARVQESGTLNQFIPDTLTTTRNMALAASEKSAGRFLFISSPSVLYGTFGGTNRRESDTLRLRRLPPYARAKVLAERVVTSAAHGFESTWILRPQAVFGAGEPHFFDRLRSIRLGRGIPIRNDGQHLIDVTSIHTVTHAIHHMLGLSRTGVTVCNIANGEPRPFRSLIQQLFDACGENACFRRIHPLPALAALFMLEHGCYLTGRTPSITPSILSKILYTRTIDTTFARSTLGIIPPVTLDDAISEYAAWWKSNHNMPKR